MSIWCIQDVFLWLFTPNFGSPPSGVGDPCEQVEVGLQAGRVRACSVCHLPLLFRHDRIQRLHICQPAHVPRGAVGQKISMGFEPKYLQDRPKSPMILLFPLFNLFTELLLLKKTTVSHFTFKLLWFRWKNCISQNTIDSLHQFQEMKFSLAALYNWIFFHFWTLDNHNATRNCLYWIDNCLYRIQTVHFHHKLHTRQWQRMLLIPVCISNLHFLISVFPWDTLWHEHNALYM